MKILVVAPLAPSTQPTNAVPLVTHTLLHALAPRHQVTLVTATEYDQPNHNSVNDWRERGIVVYCVERTTPTGIARWQRRRRMAHAWQRERLPWRTIWYWEPRLQYLIDHVLAHESFDVITAEDNAAGVYDFGKRARTILTEMEVRTLNGNATPHAATPWVRWFRTHDLRHWAQYYSRIWRRFDRIQVLTPRDAAAVGALAPDLLPRTRINPFAIELPKNAQPEREEANQVVFVGGFSHTPNVDAAVWLVSEILPRLERYCPHVHVTLVGSQPPAAVRALARENVTVTDTVVSVEPFLERAAVVLAPMRLGGGQRIKVLQGMAHAKPVVTTLLGAEGLALNGDPLPLVTAESADELADATVQLLNSVSARRRLGSAAREYVERHFSPEAYAGRLERVYSELTESRRIGS